MALPSRRAVAELVNAAIEEAAERGFVTDEAGRREFQAQVYDLVDYQLSGAQSTFRWLVKNASIEPQWMEMHRCLKCGASAVAHTIGPRTAADIVTETYIRDDDGWDLIDDGSPYQLPPKPRPTLRRVK